MAGVLNGCKLLQDPLARKGKSLDLTLASPLCRGQGGSAMGGSAGLRLLLLHRLALPATCHYGNYIEGGFEQQEVCYKGQGVLAGMSRKMSGVTENHLQNAEAAL